MRFQFRGSITLPALTLAAITATLTVAAAPSASASGDESAGQVYVLNNDLGGHNSITTFDRDRDGALHEIGVTDVGGQGSLTAFADGTQGSLILSEDGEWLFGVDAGSDQISVLHAGDGLPKLVGVYPSGGSGPISLTYHEGRLYVLNAANGRTGAANVAGFRVDDGQLRPIPGSVRALTIAHPNPAQAQLDPRGRTLLVTEKGTNTIDVFAVGAGGSLGPITAVPSIGAYPFGMAFNPARDGHEVIVADGFGGPTGLGAVTAYRLAHGRPTLINGPVSTRQVAPCWVVVTDDGRFAYTTNADSFSISGLRVGQDGSIALRDANGITATTPSDTFPLEEALAGGSRYLYTLDSRLLLPVPGPVTVSGFRIRHDGGLTPVVDEATISLPFSAVGLAAR